MNAAVEALCEAVDLPPGVPTLVSAAGASPGAAAWLERQEAKFRERARVAMADFAARWPRVAYRLAVECRLRSASLPSLVPPVAESA